MGLPGSLTDLSVLGVDGTMLVEHQLVIMRVTRLEETRGDTCNIV